MDDAGRNRVSLKYSIFDGVFASAMTGFTQEYFAPFLLLVGATARHIGMLSALPNLFASLVQIKSADLIEGLGSRKIIIKIFVLLQAAMLLPLSIVAVFGWAKPMVIIFLVILFTMFGAVATPAWGSLMSDIVAADKRGAYFGWRNKVLGFLIVGATFLAGGILQAMKKVNIFRGFAIIFSFACIFRLISWCFLMKMREPCLEFKREHYFTLFDFLSRIKESNFARFVLFVAIMNFSVNLASPFFAILMLRDLNFSYLLYAVITIIAPLTIYIMISRWGIHADRVGNLRIIKLTAPLIGVIPLLWIINRSPAFLIIAQVFSGFAWAGFNLCATNFIYDAVTPEKRSRCISYFNVLNGLALCCGALLGAALLRYLPPVLGYNILTLFVISSILRIVVSIYMPVSLKEVRVVEPVSSNELFFSIIGLKPIIGVERKTIHY